MNQLNSATHERTKMPYTSISEQTRALRSERKHNKKLAKRIEAIETENATLNAQIEQVEKQAQAREAENKGLKKDKYMLIKCLQGGDDLWLEKSVTYVDKTLYEELQALHE